ncbi:MAG: HEAT repeat domain-containing protein [Candidatus Omnitrophica bacterium]|nr:HEAT repeat domain-containing protein [Candidatus Omnitrophota bacterium]
MFKEELVKRLAEILKEENGVKEAAHFLSQIELRESLDYLISLLEEEIKKEKKIEIIYILGSSKQEKVIEALKQRLNKENKEVKVAILYSLIGMHTPKVIPILEEAINIEEIKTIALEGLGEMADLIPPEKKKEIIDLLLTSLNSKDTKEQAIVSLGKIKTERAVSYLIKLFKNENREAKKMIVQSLGNIGGEKAEDFLFEKLKEKGEIYPEIIVELEKLYLGSLSTNPNFDPQIWA